MGRSTLAAGGGRPLYSKRRCLRNQHLEIRGWILPKFPYLRQKSAGWPTGPRTEIDTTKHTTSRPPSLCVQTYHLSPTTSGTTSKSRRAHSRARPLAQSSTHDSALDRLKQQPPLGESWLLVAAIVVGSRLQACMRRGRRGSTYAALIGRGWLTISPPLTEIGWLTPRFPCPGQKSAGWLPDPDFYRHASYCTSAAWGWDGMRAECSRAELFA